MIYFTADQHFGHKNIIRLCNRPFKTVEEMDKALIDNWNSVVKSEDVVYVLGDFSYKASHHLSYYTDQLNGHRHLIIGNHDRLPGLDYEKHFETVQNYFELEITPRQYIILFHYPMLSWNKRARGAIHLYGHVHTAGQMRQIENMKTWNVGVDVNNFRPISYEDLKLIMDTKGIQASDAENTV
jgi:calcineurin-like phosphoesterase family protein